ncbi:hypothetical protein VTK73DRAFT_10207 [Phialemonium thermophilum]|uniref:Uncharacterized protein n=1 Tax=Phialemonium thermophilum TaxID=223376 RepID=A0ABR3VXZ1_9PEZI
MLASDNLSFYDPGVIEVGPTVPIESDPVAYTVDQTKGLQLGVSVGYGGASLDAEVSRERAERNIPRTDCRLLEGYPRYVQRNEGPPDGAHWTFCENVKARSGLPRVVRTAVLLERRPGDELGRFAATVATQGHVSIWADLGEKLRKFVGLAVRDDPLILDPAPRPGVAHGATVLFGTKDWGDRENPFDKNKLAEVDLDKAVFIP